MPCWNWQLPDWPKFSYDLADILGLDKQFLLDIGSARALLKNIEKSDYYQFIIEILSQEGEKSSKIEGEILDQESLQSSIKRHFGLLPNLKNEGKKEAQMAGLLCDVYESFHERLSHEMLWKWHSILFKDQSHIDDIGKYRTHIEPMQIVSNRYDISKVFFEAPPSIKVFDEMTLFIDWFNSTDSDTSILGRASLAHVYFESIHPFEDGNGRIGRLLVEKMLSQSIGSPVLIAVSKVLEQRKKEYYAHLEKCNQTLKVSHFVNFFAKAILQAKTEAMELLFFLIEKSKMLTAISKDINPRQEKALLKMFECGPSGFSGRLYHPLVKNCHLDSARQSQIEASRSERGSPSQIGKDDEEDQFDKAVASQNGNFQLEDGISAENYVAITKTSKATATRDLSDLVKIGALIKKGELRHTRYFLNLKFEP